MRCKECHIRKARRKFCSRLCSQRNANRKWRDNNREHYTQLQKESYIRRVIKQSKDDPKDLPYNTFIGHYQLREDDI